jgi:hypothetical protein
MPQELATEPIQSPPNKQTDNDVIMTEELAATRDAQQNPSNTTAQKRSNRNDVIVTAYLVVELVGGKLRELAVLNVLLPVQEVVRNPVLRVEGAGLTDIRCIAFATAGMINHYSGAKVASRVVAKAIARDRPINALQTRERNRPHFHGNRPAWQRGI